LIESCTEATEIIEIMREDQQLREPGIIQSERQVIELARELFAGQREEGAG
jgi:hypothetical protein